MTAMAHSSSDAAANPPAPDRPEPVAGHASASHRSAIASAELPVVDSNSLLRGHSSVAITHRGAIYRLQTTKQGKLILTK
jgi:hemin uptake protein HemP